MITVFLPGAPDPNQHHERNVRSHVEGGCACQGFFLSKAVLCQCIFRFGYWNIPYFLNLNLQPQTNLSPHVAAF